ncbi:MAG: topoisomerase, partial [Eubacteriales bacterium]|nr:topoisomerase [Eubacteriales bacterium]
SDKRFSFNFTASNNNGALVATESAIDLLSYLTLMKQNRHDWCMVNGVSLTGIYKPREDTLLKLLSNPEMATLLKALAKNL